MDVHLDALAKCFAGRILACGTDDDLSGSGIGLDAEHACYGVERESIAGLERRGAVLGIGGQYRWAAQVVAVAIDDNGREGGCSRLTCIHGYGDAIGALRELDAFGRRCEVEGQGACVAANADLNGGNACLGGGQQTDRGNMGVGGIGSDADTLLHVFFQNGPCGLSGDVVAMGVADGDAEHGLLSLWDRQGGLVGGQFVGLHVNGGHKGLAGGHVCRAGIAVAHADAEIGGRTAFLPGDNAAFAYEVVVGVIEQGIAALAALVGRQYHFIPSGGGHGGGDISIGDGRAVEREFAAVEVQGDGAGVFAA